MPDDKFSGRQGSSAAGGAGRSGGRDDRGGPRGGSRGGPRGRGEDGGREGRGRGRKDRDREPRDREFQEIMVQVYRCSTTVKGGRRLSFASLVVIGDGKGRVGIGYGKAKEVPGAYQKAIKSARKELATFPIIGDGTIPHAVTGRFGASQVLLMPARPGTGLIAGMTVKALLEVAGYSNLLTKSFGSNNGKNLLKATLDALGQLRSKATVEALRGVQLS